MTYPLIKLVIPWLVRDLVRPVAVYNRDLFPLMMCMKTVPQNTAMLFGGEDLIFLWDERIRCNLPSTPQLFQFTFHPAPTEIQHGLLALMNTRRRVVFAPAQLGPNASSDAPSSSQHATYSLLSLPPALLSVLNDPATASSLEIRGYRTDAAVLVTNDHTYSLRGVQNSNSLLLCSSGANDTFGEAQTEDGRGERNNLVIHETLHETLEVIQGVARTERLEGLLKSSEYIGEDAEDTVSTQTRSVCSPS